ncbi:hypothetical protein KEM54_002887 [Ascosphaera aggregata]|nr:hypothetical protein KEM54_002887 [Ascosphaera aggregata]
MDSGYLYRGGLNLTANPEEQDSSQTSNSASGLVSTLIPALASAGAMVLVFTILRRSQRRQYIPRSYIGTLRDQEKTPAPSQGVLGWVVSLAKLPDTYVLRHHSIDAYLLLRYLKIVSAICLVGCIFIWPILFPVNGTGGGGKKQLDLLSFSNVRNPKRYYAHAVMAWFFVIFVFYMVTREMVFFINLRQAYFLSPLYASRISSRTVLFMAVPEEYRTTEKMKKIYGEDKVKNVWLVTNTKELDELVGERQAAAMKLEEAETSLIVKANAARLKALKLKSKSDATRSSTIVPSDRVKEGNEEDPSSSGESGSVAAQWIKPSERPSHRLGWLCLGKKVDTIDWARKELARLTPEIEKLQAKHRAGKVPLISAVFVEFHTQTDAQSAYQVVAHNQPAHMAPRHIGLLPTDIIWENLRIRWWELVLRQIATLAFVIALVIFWAIPVAIVGMISNINYITEKLPWLGFINNCPPAILGVITGLLPSILLSVLMALVPIILRFMARLGGVTTTANLELRTQYFYFLFQVVQVFLITTFSSAATSAVQEIIQQPQKAATLLAQYLPRASNFYVSYLILQGLTFSSGALLQISDLIISKVLGRVLDNTPRKMFSRWSTLSGLGWGTIMPVVTNLAVIAITYACIAPLVLGFGCIGLYLFYIAYRYNMLYVSNTDIDTKGLIYPRALQQTLTGCYLSVLCLIGLFAISLAHNRVALGPLILMIILLVLSILYHINLNRAVNPLLYYLPKVLESAEEELLNSEQNQQNEDPEQGLIGDQEKIYSLEQIGAAPLQTKHKIAKFLFPYIYANYTQLRKLVPRNYADIQYTEEIENSAYYHPSVTDQPPLLWIPRDEGGVSKQEVEHTSKVIEITDEDATLDENNKIRWNVELGRPPIYEEKIYY